MQTIVLRTDEALSRLSAEWSQLEPSTPFASWEFARAWLDQRPKGTEAFVIVVRSAKGMLLAIAPWCVQRMTGGLRRLTGIGAHDSWQHDPILLQPERAPAIGTQLAECLWRHRRAWDWVSLNLKSQASLPLLNDLATRGWVIEDHDDRHQHNLIEFGSDFAAYWAERSSSHRSKVRSLNKRLKEVPHRYVLAEADTFEEVLSAFFALHAERWRGLRDWQPYYDQKRALSRRAMARGELVLGVLEIDGRPAAFDLSLVSGDRGFGLMRIFNPDFAAYAPGTLLSIWMLEQLHARGARTVDCGPGHYEWKERYSTGQLPGMRALVTSRTNLGGLAVLGWLGLLKPWRTKAVPSMELKERLQALLGRTRSPQARPHSC